MNLINIENIFVKIERNPEQGKVVKGRIPSIEKFFISIKSANFTQRTIKEYEYKNPWHGLKGYDR